MIVWSMQVHVVLYVHVVDCCTLIMLQMYIILYIPILYFVHKVQCILYGTITVHKHKPRVFGFVTITRCLLKWVLQYLLN